MSKRSRENCITLRISIYLIITMSVSISSLSGCARANGLRTFDSCKTNDDCARRLYCLGVFENQIAACTPGVKDCICAPFGRFLDCKKSTDCPNREGCAVSPRSGRKLCASCAVIKDTSRNYSHVDPTSGECNSLHAPGADDSAKPTPTTEISLRGTGDLCSRDLKCRRSLTCLDVLRGVKCKRYSTFCRCIAKKVQSCSAKRPKCPVGEVCAFNAIDGTSKCLGCSVVENDISLNSKDSSKCNNIKPQPLPKYKPGPNGLTFDTCIADDMCESGLKCVLPTKSRNIPCNKSRSVCYCLKKNLAGCSRSKQCRQGEICAKLRLAKSAKCLSQAFLAHRKAFDFKIIKEKKNENEEGTMEENIPPTVTKKGLTGAPCKYDWECKPDRRCTHVQEGFGGCAGRDNCVCKPLINAKCTRHGDCKDRGEACAHYPESQISPFCYDAKSIRETPFLNRLDRASKNPSTLMPLLSTPGRGLTYDLCVNTDDCAGARVCRHVIEEFGSCDGRSSCVCKQIQTCNTSDDCDNGESCVAVRGSLRPNPQCISTEVLPSWDPMYEDWVKS